MPPDAAGPQDDPLDLENWPDGLQSLAPDGTVLWANRAGLSLLGYGPDEVVGHHMSEFHVDQDSIRDILSQLEAGRDFAARAASMRCRNGAVRDVQLQASGRYRDGTLLHFRPIPPLRWAASTKEADQAQARLAAIVQASDDAIVSMSLNGRIATWNAAAERLFGYEAAEAIGHPIAILLPDDREAENEEILGRLKRGERVSAFETVRVRKDGSRVEVSLTVSPVFDAVERIIGMSMIARDVTRRREAEELVRRSEERYRRLAEIMPVGVYTCEAPSGRITYCNEHALRMWGRTPEAGDSPELCRYCGSFRMLTSDTHEVVPPEECPMATALHEGQSFRNREVILERPGGSRISVLVNIEPIRDDSGRVVGAINAFHDVTTAKDTEATLRERTESLQALLETLPVAVFIAHDRDCRRITGNGAAADFLRLDDRHASFSTSVPNEGPRNFRTTRHGRVLPLEALPIHRAARWGKTVWGEDIDIEFDDGTVAHTLVSARPLFDDRGEPRGAVGCLLDVTDLKKSEMALREADRRKNEFLATLSHELRTPLVPLVAGLEVMKLADADEADVARSRATIERQTERLTALVDDLLDVSRITTGKLKLRKRLVLLADIVGGSVEEVHARIKESGQTLTVELPGPLYVDADPGRLVQVLSNLLDNASKFTPSGGRISLTARAEGNKVAVAVADTGVGIPADELRSIFEMFAQTDPHHERGDSALGVGLALAESLVLMHGGSIQAETGGLGRGSTFTVTLPLADAPSEASESDHGRPGATDEGPVPGRRVLVVDDNDDVVDSLALLVEMLGNEVRVALDGHQAVEAADEFRPDIVFMDLGMPRMSGYEAARRIRREPWGADVTLVAMTGWGQEEDKQRTREAGFDHHLVKPPRPTDLRRILSG